VRKRRSSTLSHAQTAGETLRGRRANPKHGETFGVTWDQRASESVAAVRGTSTAMDKNQTLLVSQLNGLLRLTQTEAIIADTRRAQATSDHIERELRTNADKCNERRDLIADALRELGQVPDVVGGALARAAAIAKLSAEQGQPMEEALLGDLQLEHQLLDRTRFARLLADQTSVPAKVTRVLDRLEVAHSATIEWLMQRLAEVALGGPPALRPSPMQAAVGVGRRLSVLPARQTANTVNRSLATVGSLQQRAGEVVETNVERVRQLAGAAGEIWSAGRNASLEQAEESARRRGDRQIANRVNRARRELGAVDAAELPIRGYDDKGVGDIVARVQRLRDPEQVRTVLAYEQANKARKGVIEAAQSRLEALASALVGA